MTAPLAAVLIVAAFIRSGSNKPWKTALREHPGEHSPLNPLNRPLRTARAHVTPVAFRVGAAGARRGFKELPTPCTTTPYEVLGSDEIA